MYNLVSEIFDKAGNENFRKYEGEFVRYYKQI